MRRHDIVLLYSGLARLKIRLNSRFDSRLILIKPSHWWRCGQIDSIPDHDVTGVILCMRSHRAPRHLFIHVDISIMPILTEIFWVPGGDALLRLYLAQITL